MAYGWYDVKTGCWAVTFSKGAMGQTDDVRYVYGGGTVTDAAPAPRDADSPDSENRLDGGEKMLFFPVTGDEGRWLPGAAGGNARRTPVTGSKSVGIHPNSGGTTDNDLFALSLLLIGSGRFFIS